MDDDVDISRMTREIHEMPDDVRAALELHRQTDENTQVVSL